MPGSRLGQSLPHGAVIARAQPAQFDKDGNPVDEAKLQTCYPCYTRIRDRDFVFTRYAP